jgi:hypothetical protein
MGFPAVNALEDPTYEQGLTPGSVLPALAQCSLDDREIPKLRRQVGRWGEAGLGHDVAPLGGSQLPAAVAIALR